jgi:hypothetical protein
MRPQPESSSQEVLAGLVERVTYHNPENGFCVLRAKVRGTRLIWIKVALDRSLQNCPFHVPRGGGSS